MNLTWMKLNNVEEEEKLKDGKILDRKNEREEKFFRNSSNIKKEQPFVKWWCTESTSEGKIVLGKHIYKR